ncbi:L-aspartate oxidase [Lysinibacter cavernae]|uniref:L-aspartate oxidase n=1 Tax=Lysinibacter cavernae TaxID=1640652 RepID=A0A7X5R2A2_9MICO|nr:L-aspartate oxidase [Lysinibacter cavernae]
MIVVVGSGLAGITAALAAADFDDVTMVTKAALEMSNTFAAQGGIAAALGDDDSAERHLMDTLAAGNGLVRASAARVLTAEGPQRIHDLIGLGVAFDRDASGNLARGLEAAHSRHRIVHAGGDATGAVIETALAQRIREGRVSVLEYRYVADIRLKDGRAAGVELLADDGTREVLDASAVVLATGGAGQLYSHTTNPAIATGDGVAAAARAGAVLCDLEFYQFHPTALAVEGNFLVSEAVRGAGAVLVDERGHRFMVDAHPAAELAPRDVVARTIATVMAEQGGRPVMLRAPGLGEPKAAAYLATRFPTINRVCAENGFDWAREPIPVTPAAHYWMGGIRTDHDGRTSIPGLFAAGEAANTGVHGANRLASNSLLEAVVFGRRAGVAAATGGHRDDHFDGGEPASVCALPPAVLGMEPTACDVRELMWSEVGLARDGNGLGRAATRLGEWAAALSIESQHGQDQAGRVSGATASMELLNLATLGHLIAVAASERDESRGAHLRTDARQSDPAKAFSRNYIFSAPYPATRNVCDLNRVDRLSRADRHLSRSA